MVTHKDLNVQIPWKCIKSNVNVDSWEIRGTMNKLFGTIFYSGGGVYISAHLFNKRVDKHIKINKPFNYQDYIPEWENCMDQLLATIFK